VKIFNLFLKVLYNNFIIYTAPSNLNIMWTLGSLGLFFLLCQIGTGVWLAMYYIPMSDLSFNSIDFIMREVNYG
jgi:ubiquinol-cytochrome c reductase cytochrome b subunit